MTGASTVTERKARAMETRPMPLAELADRGLVVPVLGGDRVAHTNLDLAASAPPLVAVAQHVAEITPWYSSVHRGTGYASELATELVEGSRAAVARHVGARDGDVVVFTRNTTDALNLLASAVPGDVVVLDVEHHANLLPWRNRRVVVAQPSLEATLRALEAELARRSAALLTVTGASNVTGELLPIERLAELAHAHGARLAVDAAQLLPHRRVSLTESGADYLAFSGHKAYAPYGAGALVGRADWLDRAAPYLAGGGAVAAVALDAVAWRTGSERHEAGTPNVLGAAAIAAALAEFERLGEPARAAHERALTERLTAGVERVPGVRRIRAFEDAPDALGIVTLELERGSVGLLAAALSAEHGVSVRAGRFCAHPLFDRVASRANGLRASVGLGTGAAEIDRFLAALERLVAEGPRAKYRRTPDGWKPVSDDRPRPALLHRAG
ncbi:aminotransferase class V-fold PLP-dependent enzyme [Agromyces mediolanus]|uniref:aminotransferase class V-fold PLP-dependent enzyme n=1 Tax=Agromyces mediolanus TaxID=41986 RepID=UPI00203A3B09|nr:aminotransferase class V-fold PLP-dependent enzyme [Agromyces mediolanus]MCM3657859.1 aminotransferase class V-fold PLP-dependent enzyme [Agromyces mediolanus]